MYEDVHLDVCSFEHPVAAISVLSKLKFLFMYWPGMADRYLKMGALLSIVVELWKEELNKF